ncbi:MAG: 5-oxoprolinase subunit PxpA, partial [Ideonella sp.]
MPRLINLNADLGESFGAWTMGEDAALLGVVRSANIACGFHAGDPLVMRQTVRTALAAEVGLGAHPAYPDLQGFGRRPMKMTPAELEAAVIYQIGALAGMAAAEGGRLTHVKPHGALSNQACVDGALADSVARAVRAFDRTLILLAPALSELLTAGERAGLPVASEIFADRAYAEDATLAPRAQPGAVLH